MATKQSKHATREAWLEKGVAALAPVFAKAGHPLPPVRVSCSWPGGGSARKRIGECWAKKMSKAGINEIFVSPMISDSVAALDILTHELVHAVDDCVHGHKAEFARIGTAVGLEGKPTQMRAGKELRAVLETIVAKLGTYPHSKLDLSSRKKKGTYLVKCQCSEHEECGAVWRMTTSWIDKASANDGLLCPVCGSHATAGDEEESEDE